MISTIILQPSEQTKKYSKDREAESECERIKEWEGGGGELSLAPWHADKWQQSHYNIER